MSSDVILARCTRQIRSSYGHGDILFRNDGRDTAEHAGAKAFCFLPERHAREVDVALHRPETPTKPIAELIKVAIGS